MELIKKSVHLNKKKGEVTTQITLENDFNVSDQKPDVDEVITDNCDLKIESVKILNGKTEIKGKLVVSALYVSPDGSQPVWDMTMEIPFSEPVNMDMLEDGDTVKLDYKIENVKVNVINSRKISVKAIITFMLAAETIYDMDIAVAPDEDENVEYIKKQLKIMQIIMKKKDVFRIKEEIDIAQGKPNINCLLWKNAEIRNYQTKLMDNKINLSGELVLFTIYQPEDENMPVQWIDSVISFGGIIDAEGCNEEMIQDISVSLAEMNIDIKPDYDGEQRIFEVDAVLDLDIRVYEEDSIDILDDVYSSYSDLVPIRENACGESLIMKNISKCKVTDKIKIDTEKNAPDSRILQVCNTTGKLCVDSVTPYDDGLEVEGAIEVQMLYISSDDKRSFCSAKGVIPFTCNADIKGMDSNSTYNVSYLLEQLTHSMTGDNEAEIKAVISMDISARNKVDESVIVGVEEKEMDMDKIKRMPGIIIYNVQKGDSLWSIAKQFHTSVTSLKEINNIHGDSIKMGESMLVVKQLEEIG